MSKITKKQKIRALKKSIERWLVMPDHIDWSTRYISLPSGRHALGSDNCALCRLYMHQSEHPERYCVGCPLARGGATCDSPNHAFSIAREGLYASHKPLYMNGRYNLLRRMRRALAKLENS